MERHDPALPAEPPEDAEQWSDEQWITWLSATDNDARDIDGDIRPSTPFGRITHSAGGSVLGQAMLAMANAIYGRKDDEIVIVAERSGEADDDQPFRVHLDPEHPERSAVVFPAEAPCSSDRTTSHEADPAGNRRGAKYEAGDAEP